MFFFQAEDGIRDIGVTGVQTCALPIFLGGKAYMVRDGVFNGVDAVLFTHVGNNLETTWGQPRGTGMVSVEYTYSGESAHSASAPWRGRSALDGVELMNIGWNMRREHLRPEQRSHYVIPDGGDQPNVVPSVADR